MGVAVAIGLLGSAISVTVCPTLAGTYPAVKTTGVTESSCLHQISTLDSDGNVGEHTSITIGADGLGLISFYAWQSGDLYVVHLPLLP